MTKTTALVSLGITIFFTAGDIGRLAPDGYLYILDRKKDMIIAGGVNIYPAEIETRVDYARNRVKQWADTGIVTGLASQIESGRRQRTLAGEMLLCIVDDFPNLLPILQDRSVVKPG